jgi:histidyl-tRNA synthetase
VAQHNNALAFPFKRYQLQKVWRGDRPQKGRFREFYQFDIDIIARNELPLSCDAEVVTVVGLVMETLNFGPYSIRVNNRKLLQGLYQAVGLDEQARKSAIIAVDKILKIGRDDVAAELRKIEGVSQQAVDAILNSTTVQCPVEQLVEKVRGLDVQSDLINEGVQELVTVCNLLPASVRAKVTIDLSLARGLDYYTGLIMELGMDRHPEFGTLVAGGRYENLAGDFCDQKLPGVGVSLGLSRLMELVVSEKLVDTTRKSPTRALVTVLSEDDRVLSNEVAQELRNAGVPTEVFYRSPKLGKQIDYADAKGIQYVLFVDPSTREVKVKDLVTKEQVVVPSIAAWARDIS